MDNDKDFVNYNISKKKKAKRNKDVLKYAKTCAIYGIFDCICCNKNDIVYDSVIDETINKPSTSRLSNNEDDIIEQNSNDDIIDVGIDCIPSTSNKSSSEELTNNKKEICDRIGIKNDTKLNETMDDVMAYVNSVYEEYGCETDTEINILNEINNEIQSNETDISTNATIATTSDSLTTDETIANKSIKSEVSPVQEEEEEIDVVNIPADDTQNIFDENNYNHAETVQQETAVNEIKMEYSDDENQIIDILNFDDADRRENLTNFVNSVVNTESTSNENEDEIIDVENVNEGSTPPPQPPHDDDYSIGQRLRRNSLKRRLRSQITINFHKRPRHSRIHRSVMTIDLINTSRNDSIIEITDSPVVPRKVTEVINVDDDDDDDDENEEHSLNTCATNRSIGLGNCPVCLESLAKKEIMSTICGHVYCARCIKNVIKTTKKCPNCRKCLSLKSIHPLFI